MTSSGAGSSLSSTPFQFGGAPRPSTHVSTYDSIERRRGLSVGHGEVARDILMNIRRDDEEEQRRSRSTHHRQSLPQSVYELVVDDRDLLQRGILHSVQDDHQVAANMTTDHPSNAIKMHSGRHHGGMYVNDGLSQQSLVSLNAVLRLPTRSGSSHHPGTSDRSGSPDSGYGRTPDNPNLGALSPNSRSRSCSSEASTATPDSSDASGRRHSPLSGHWSSHESALALVAEEERKSDGDTVESYSGALASCNESDHLHSPEIPLHLSDTSLPSPTDTNQFYHSDDGTLLHIPSRNSRQVLSPLSQVAITQSTTNSETGKPVNFMPHTSRKNSEVSRWRKRVLKPRVQVTNKDSDLASQEVKDYFQKTDELTRENAHFTLSEALLAVLEEYKSNLREEQFEDQFSVIESIPVSPHDSSSVSTLDYTSPHSNGSTNTLCSLGSSVQYDVTDGSPPSVERGTYSSPKLQGWTNSTWNTSHHSNEFYEGLGGGTSYSTGREVKVLKLMNTSSDSASPSSAENVAQSLLHHIGSVLGGSRQVEFRVPQVVQLPMEFISSIQNNQELQYSFTSSASPMRGNHYWAPPRQQIIYNLHTPPRQIQPVLEQQGNRCIGCGMNMDPNQVKLLRFCHYMGKYFCMSCHHNATSAIPAHVIHKWSFKKYVVSDFARDTLAKLENEPIFNLKILNPFLYNKVPELGKAKEAREQLVILKKYLMACSRAKDLQTKFEPLGHLVTDCHTYSLSNFIQIKNGHFLKHLQLMVVEASKHIKSCPVCEGQGFVCEFCHQMDDIIYPFEIAKVRTCSECHCCFHRECYQGNSSCPRCDRIKRRQKQRVREIMLEDGDDLCDS